MGNDANDIDRIAPTPWTPCGKRQAEDANGLLVFTCSGEMPQVAKRRDRIIACVNFCAGIKTEDLEAVLMPVVAPKGMPSGDRAVADWVRDSRVERILSAIRKELSNV